MSMISNLVPLATRLPVPLSMRRRIVEENFQSPVPPIFYGLLPHVSLFPHPNPNPSVLLTPTHHSNGNVQKSALSMCGPLL